MKKILLLIILPFLGLVTACEQTVYETGFFENGEVRTRIAFVGDSKNGIAKYYQSNGVLIGIKHYENDVLEGSYKIF